MVGVAQSVRAPGCGPGGRGFKSRRSPLFFAAPLSWCGFEEVGGEEEGSAKPHRESGWGEADRHHAMHYVYILVSLEDPTRYYIGKTEDLKARLQQHNRGESGYSKRYAPWRLETYTVFSKPHLADGFECYLKSGSGHAFLKKRLLPKI